MNKQQLDTFVCKLPHMGAVIELKSVIKLLYEDCNFNERTTTCSWNVISEKVSDDYDCMCNYDWDPSQGNEWVITSGSSGSCNSIWDEECTTVSNKLLYIIASN